jgi:hypothetical protein
MISIQAVTRVGLLPATCVLWPPPLRRLVLGSRKVVVVICPAMPPAPAGSLELAGLPRPNGGTLAVPLERLPFHQSPGRWHFRCPCCGDLRGVLLDVAVGGTLRANPAAVALGWACRTCAGLPKSRAWPLSVSQRLDNALERAADERRRPGEKARDWRRRRQWAALAIAKARETDSKTVENWPTKS